MGPVSRPFVIASPSADPSGDGPKGREVRPRHLVLEIGRIAPVQRHAAGRGGVEGRARDVEPRDGQPFVREGAVDGGGVNAETRIVDGPSVMRPVTS